MIADSEYKRFQFQIADLLAASVIVAVVAAACRFPPSSFQAILLFVVLYVVKFRILTLRVQWWLALSLYVLLVAALLPYLYFHVDKWEGFSAQGKWIGGPIAVFTVPTAFYLFDVFAHRVPSWKFYAARSLLEIVILFPAWGITWLFFELFVLRWCGMSFT
ncbi:MAG: hypothetical protein ACLP9L_40130 [Thermoguttaceae bacterium]